MTKNCVYCKINPAGNSDHVFPKSLGGESIFMDCVCNKCNNDFSLIERELFQKSIIGLMRSYEGIEGYSKNKNRPAPLKYPEIFQCDKDNKIVYEVGLSYGFNPYVRPQFIKVADKFYGETPTEEEMKLFVDSFNNWRFKNLVMITKFPVKKGDSYEAVSFLLVKKKYKYEKIELPKVKKEIIHYTLMKDNDEFKDFFEPRMFFDDSSKIIVRSRSIDEGINFVCDLLNYCNKDAASFSSFSEKKSKDALRVSMKFDAIKMQQALVKIGLNCLMHYYPLTKENLFLQPIIDYVRKGIPIRMAVDKKIDLLDTRTDIHTVLFYQLKEGLMIRSSLFGGHFTYSFIIENLKVFNSPGQLSGIEVDFKNSKQKHFSMYDFLLNRVSDLGYLKNDTID
jgi:hypothetical protein